MDRLHDYEMQIDQLVKLQRLWYGFVSRLRHAQDSIDAPFRDSDVQKLNDTKVHLAAADSKYRKMELRLEAYEATQLEMEQAAA